jgi:type I restriction enzyme R subunit
VLKNEKYVMKITGDDDIGKAQLDNFINPKKPTRLSRQPLN